LTHQRTKTNAPAIPSVTASNGCIISLQLYNP
jgi:hypothetical protein